MKLVKLLTGLKPIILAADPDTDIMGISYDSRKTQPGDLFVAIRGYETDGHRYIAKALEKGASVILCAEKPSVDCAYVLVSDSRLALALVSAEFFEHPASGMQMIGITGTSGKTTVSTLLKHVLEEAGGKKVGLIGTNGIWIDQEELHTEHTTPESFELQKLFREMADAGCSHVVMEVSSHALALDRVAGLQFDTVLFTNLSQDHLDFHGSMEQYAAAKKKIFHQAKFGYVNRDDAWATFMMTGEDCQILTYGLTDSADLQALNPEYLSDRVCFELQYDGKLTPVELRIPGIFSVYNALSVMALALSAGIEAKAAADALRTAAGVRGRLEALPTDGEYQIYVDYSHKPDALEKVLRSLRTATKAKLICVFGCGGDRDRLKRPLMGKIATALADYVIITSDNPRTEDPESILDEIEAGITENNYSRICDRKEAIHRAIDMAEPGDVILLAGKGHEDYQVIGHEKRHMDEHELVAEYFNLRKTEKT